MITILAMVCTMLQDPASNCSEKFVISGSLADIPLQSCLMGAPQLAEWMKNEHPDEILMGWKCVIGQKAREI